MLFQHLYKWKVKQPRQNKINSLNTRFRNISKSIYIIHNSYYSASSNKNNKSCAISRNYSTTAWHQGYKTSHIPESAYKLQNLYKNDYDIQNSILPNHQLLQKKPKYLGQYFQRLKLIKHFEEKTIYWADRVSFFQQNIRLGPLKEKQKNNYFVFTRERLLALTDTYTEILRVSLAYSMYTAKEKLEFGSDPALEVTNTLFREHLKNIKKRNISNKYVYKELLPVCYDTHISPGNSKMKFKELVIPEHCITLVNKYNNLHFNIENHKEVSFSIKYNILPNQLLSQESPKVLGQYYYYLSELINSVNQWHVYAIGITKHNFKNKNTGRKYIYKRLKALTQYYEELFRIMILYEMYTDDAKYVFDKSLSKWSYTVSDDDEEQFVSSKKKLFDEKLNKWVYNSPDNEKQYTPKKTKSLFKNKNDTCSNFIVDDIPYNSLVQNDSTSFITELAINEVDESASSTDDFEEEYSLPKLTLNELDELFSKHLKYMQNNKTI